MKTDGGMDVYFRLFLTSALVGGEWSAPRLGRFTPGTHRIRGWVGAPEPIWTTWRGEISFTHQNSNSDALAFPPVASRYAD
jgi:hypothetical protein